MGGTTDIDNEEIMIISEKEREKGEIYPTVGSKIAPFKPLSNHEYHNSE